MLAVALYNDNPEAMSPLRGFAQGDTLHPVYARHDDEVTDEQVGRHYYLAECEHFFRVLNEDDRPLATVIRSMSVGDAVLFVPDAHPDVVHFFTCESAGFQERNPAECWFTEATRPLVESLRLLLSLHDSIGIIEGGSQR